MPQAPLFFFGAMSPYSWLAAERIEALLPRARWRALFLGALFKDNGRTSWGLTELRDQGLADCERRAAAHGLGTISWPDPWPTNDLLIARAMTHAQAEGRLSELALAAMRMAFLEGADLGQRETVLLAGGRVGISPGELDAALEHPPVKQALHDTNAEAAALGVFGAPTVAVGEELFWGDDRLLDAVQAHGAQGST